MPGEEQPGCHQGGRRQGHGDQEHVGDQVGEDHGVDEPEPRGEPRGDQQGEPREELGAEEDPAERGEVELEARVEPVGHEALDHEAAREGVEREQRGDSPHEGPRREARARSRGGAGRGLRPQERVERELEDAAHEEDGEKRGGRCRGAGHEGRAESGGDVARQVVEAQHAGQALARRRPRDRHLLERQEGPGLAGPHGEIAHHGCGHDDPRLLRDKEESC